MAASSGVSEIAGRYATALFDLADEQNQLDAVADDLRQIDSLIVESADLNQLVRSPVLKRDDQGRAINAVLEKMGVNDLTKRFVGYVAANRRLFALRAMIKAYLAELASRRGEVTAEVTSAKKLTAKQVQSLEAVLKEAVGGDVAINHSVNPSLIGGLVVQVGSRMVDFSVSTQLQKLKLAMKGA